MEFLYRGGGFYFILKIVCFYPFLILFTVDFPIRINLAKFYGFVSSFQALVSSNKAFHSSEALA